MLAKFLHLSDKIRAQLQIRTIGSVDLSKQQRARRRREQKRAQKQINRRRQGVKSRAEYLRGEFRISVTAVEGRGHQQTDLVLPKEGNCTGPGAAIYPLAPAPAG